MTFNASLGFAGLKNEKGKEEADKNYALFIGETIIANEVSNMVVATLSCISFFSCMQTIITCSK